MKVENGFNVKMHYRGTLADGTEFDSSRVRGQAIEFEVGAPNVIKGFSKAVIGMSVGETKTVAIAADDAYGQITEDAIQNVPKAQFDDDFVFEVGALVIGRSPDGEFRAKIHEIHDDHVVLDLNHPLAGQDLTFEMELISIDSPRPPQMVNWNTKMKKAELFEIAKSQGLSVNTRSTKAQIIEALSA